MKIRRALPIARIAPWLARLALFALLFQISAIDHHSHPADVIGVIGTSAHEMHCHGSTGSCANGIGDSPVLAASAELVPAASPSLYLAVALESGAPPAPFMLVETEPPRA